MHAETITTYALGFIAFWVVAVALHALFLARQPRWDPAPPEMPEHHGHDDHGHDHGHGGHGHDHGHAAHGHDHGHGGHGHGH